jgi:hypothetical protein
MSHFRIPADKKIDPSKLDAWIQMITAQRAVHSPGPAFLYIEDIRAATSGTVIDPVALLAAIEAKTVRNTDPADGVPFIYLDDLLDGFRGTRLERLQE